MPLRAQLGTPHPGPVPDGHPGDLPGVYGRHPGDASLRPRATATGRTPAARPDLKPGDELAGFEIIRPLNRGGMGVVYKARQRGLDRLVALKVIAPERLTGKDHAEYLKRFRREARAAALLNHPNIVTVYATDLTGPRPYFAMEFVEGIDLYRLVKHSGPLGFWTAATTSARRPWGCSTPSSAAWSTATSSRTT